MSVRASAAGGLSAILVPLLVELHKAHCRFYRARRRMSARAAGRPLPGLRRGLSRPSRRTIPAMKPPGKETKRKRSLPSRYQNGLNPPIAEPAKLGPQTDWIGGIRWHGKHSSADLSSSRSLESRPATWLQEQGLSVSTPRASKSSSWPSAASHEARCCRTKPDPSCNRSVHHGSLAFQPLPGVIWVGQTAPRKSPTVSPSCSGSSR